MSRHAKEGGPRRRFTIDMSESEAARLDAAAKKLEMTNARTLRTALFLLHDLLKRQENGSAIFITERDAIGREQELVFPELSNRANVTRK